MNTENRIPCRVIPDSPTHKAILAHFEKHHRALKERGDFMTRVGMNYAHYLRAGLVFARRGTEDPGPAFKQRTASHWIFSIEGEKTEDFRFYSFNPRTEEGRKLAREWKAMIPIPDGFSLSADVGVEPVVIGLRMLFVTLGWIGGGAGRQYFLTIPYRERPPEKLPDGAERIPWSAYFAAIEAAEEAEAGKTEGGA